METPLAEFVSAGFLITRQVLRPAYASAALLPERIISLSGCIAAFVPDSWCLEWAQDPGDGRAHAAREFALDAEALARLIEWVTPRFGEDVGWPNVIYELETAREIRRLFLNGAPGVKVLEVALHKSMAEAFCRRASRPSAASACSRPS